MIAVVVPTCRPELYEETFLPAWEDQFQEYNVDLITVYDHQDPKKVTLEHRGKKYPITELLPHDSDLIYNRSACIKNLGFYFVSKYLKSQYIVALDDDVTPVGDTIGDHVRALNLQVPISWMSIGDTYTRGFPYSVRKEAEVVFSHGVWDGVPDLDAPTQLVRGIQPMKFIKGVIPKNIYYPMCEMNIAFKRKMLPYMYLAPDSPEFGFGRNDDIFCGINSKRVIDKKGWAVVTGYSRVYHNRASNVFSSLKKEAKFIEINETYWQGDESDPYFKVYNAKRKRWEELLSED